jgi:hypothetical protein
MLTRSVAQAAACVSKPARPVPYVWWMVWPKSSRACAGSAKFAFPRARTELFWRCKNRYRSMRLRRPQARLGRSHQRSDLAACSPGWARRWPSFSGRWCLGQPRFGGTWGARRLPPIIPRASTVAGTTGEVAVGAHAAGGDVGSWRTREMW